MTEIVECLALNAAWIGFDALFDDVIFPDNVTYSLIATFTSSHVTYFFIVIFQSAIFRRAAKLELIYRLIVENLIQIYMFISAVIAWKFYYDFIDNYLVTSDNQLTVYLYLHFLTFVCGVVLKVTAILVGPGVSFLDGEWDTDSEVYFDIEYVSHIFQV